MAVTTSPSGVTELELLIGGMTCAACAARVQTKLNKLDGVIAAVNFATERARVIAPPGVTGQVLISAVEAAGDTAELAAPPGAPAAGEAVNEAAVRRLRGRLILALMFFVPLTDLSIMLSLFPWSRFPGWQWLLVALAAPVATWAAWPFHQAALQNARHLSSSMDTLVSLGILAACGWSVYAMFVLDRGPARPAVRSLMHASGGGIYLEVAASVTTFLLAGRLYEARARRTAGEAMRDLAAAGAQDVCVLADDGTRAADPRVAWLQVGQRFVVRPGERIAADGEVLSGQSAIDRSMMTGESVPVDAAAGDTVTGGTDRADRPAGRPRPAGRAGHPARPADRDGRAGPGREGRHPAAGRPHLRGLRPGRAGLRRPHPGRLAPGRQPGRARLQRRPGRADHRLPLRPRPGHPRGPGRGLRPRRPARHLHQGLPGPGVLPRASTPWCWTRPARSPPAG